jgi:hypothetical protein
MEAAEARETIFYVVAAIMIGAGAAPTHSP